MASQTVIDSADPASNLAHGRNTANTETANRGQTVLPTTTTTIDGPYSVGSTTSTHPGHKVSADSHATTSQIPTQYSQPNAASGVAVGTAQLGVPHTIASKHSTTTQDDVAVHTSAPRNTDNDLRPYPGEPIGERHIDHHPFGHAATQKFAPAANAHGVSPASDLTASANAVSGNLLPYGVTHTTQGPTGTFEPKDHMLATSHEHNVEHSGHGVIDKIKQAFGGGHELENVAKPRSSTEYEVNAAGKVVGKHET